MSYRLQSGNRQLGGHSELVRLRQQRFMGWDRQVRAVEMSKPPTLTFTSECSGSAMRTRARIGRTCSGSSRVPSALQPGGRLVRVPHFRVANSDHMAIGTRPPAQQTQKQYHQHHFYFTLPLSTFLATQQYPCNSGTRSPAKCLHTWRTRLPSANATSPRPFPCSTRPWLCVPPQHR